MSSIAVIQARLPYVDRRSLSEAWFSALHLARSRDPIFYRRPVLASTSQLSERSCATGRRGGALAAQSRSTGVSGAIVRRGDATDRSRSCESPPERVMRGRRREAVEVCHGWQSEGGVETGLSRRRAIHASFAIALEGGRVQVLLRREGRVLHVVAVCSERHAELVRRALACADLHLRARGEIVRSQVRAL